MKCLYALIALCLFTSTAFALPTFNPQIVLENQQGETSVNAIKAGSVFPASFRAATVTLTAAQVIALPGTPIQLVAAQSGKLIQVVAVEYIYTKGAAAFTIGASKNLIVEYNTSGVNIQLMPTTGFIDQSTSKTAFTYAGSVAGVGIGGQAVQITSDDTTPVSGGTGSTVKVIVYYNLINVL
ncbi:MAG: hypothetical protein OEW15_11605 [Nitrospirota bacterium]|nr:hypothetical protein [Nitrospirota bacterium]